MVLEWPFGLRRNDRIFSQDVIWYLHSACLQVMDYQKWSSISKYLLRKDVYWIDYQVFLAIVPHFIRRVFLFHLTTTTTTTTIGGNGEAQTFRALPAWWSHLYPTASWACLWSFCQVSSYSQIILLHVALAGVYTFNYVKILHTLSACMEITVQFLGLLHARWLLHLTTVTSTSERSPIFGSSFVPVYNCSSIGWSRAEEDEASVTRKSWSEAVGIGPCICRLHCPIHILLQVEFLNL